MHRSLFNLSSFSLLRLEYPPKWLSEKYRLIGINPLQSLSVLFRAIPPLFLNVESIEFLAA